MVPDGVGVRLKLPPFLVSVLAPNVSVVDEDEGAVPVLSGGPVLSGAVPEE